jgi:predicted DNA-binding protein with PD1-like motif
VRTSGGPIEVTGLSGNLDGHPSGGSIHLREATGDAHVETSGGPIDVEALDGNLQAHTSGGGIRIRAL